MKATDGVVVWITGLPSAGKSTFAQAAAELLRERGVLVAVLDGDEVRGALLPAPGYSPQERDDFYATLGNLALLLSAQGLTVLVPATASKAEFRRRIRERAGHFLEVFVDVPLEEVRRRDAKGLYAASKLGDVSSLPGVGAGYDVPEHPDVTARGGRDQEALELLARLLS